MKKVIIPVVILLAAAAAGWGIGQPVTPPQAKPEPYRPPIVETVEAHPVATTFNVVSQGTVTPKWRSQLVSEVSGRITAIAADFQTGNFVNKQQWLVKLEDIDYQTALSRAQANLAAAKAALSEERARGHVAERDWRTIDPDKQPALGLRKPQLQEALANLKYAQAQLKLAQRNVERTTITAPYDGLVELRDVDVGQYVEAGTVLGRVVGTQLAQVRLPIDEAKLNDLFAHIQFGDLPDDLQRPVQLSAVINGQPREWSAHLVRVEGLLDEHSRFARVVAELDDPYGLHQPRPHPLPFGQFVNATIEGRYQPHVVKLPRYVVDEQQRVAIIADGHAQWRKVEVLRTQGDTVYIGAGLQEGQQVIASPVTEDMIDHPVRLANQTTSSADNAGHALIVMRDEQS